MTHTCAGCGTQIDGTHRVEDGDRYCPDCRDVQALAADTGDLDGPRPAYCSLKGGRWR